MTEYDRDIIETMGNKIIDLCDNSTFYKVLEENYSLGLNRINWSDVPDHIEVNLSDADNRSKKIAEFFVKITALNPEIINDTVIVWGDEAIENAYQMTFVEFENTYTSFFSLPQHTYVWLENSRKLINYTFEDDLYYG